MKTAMKYLILSVGIVCSAMHLIAKAEPARDSVKTLHANRLRDGITIGSPDNRLAIVLEFENDKLSYAVLRDGLRIILPSAIAVSLDGQHYPAPALDPQIQSPYLVKKTVEPEVRLKTAKFTDEYREMFLKMTPQVGLRLRVYNDAAAFRWELQGEQKEVIVNTEQFDMVLDDKLSGWIPRPNGDGYFSHQECLYVKKSLRSAHGPFCVPMLIDLNEGLYLLTTDVNVEHYPGLWMISPDGQARFSTAFPAYPKKVALKGSRSNEVLEREDFIAKVPGQYHFPWRVMMVTDAKGIIESNTLYALADENRIGDTSWIKPGKVSWEWWNSFALKDVPFKPGVNQASYMHYIDFAAENDIPYVLMDEGWSVKKPEDFPGVVQALNMPELSEYARGKGVRLLLWTTSTALEMNFEEAFNAFEKWQIAGIKVDFMQRDDQVMQEYCYRVSEEAAKRKLLVDFHGGSKPTGLTRTYPNVMTHEAVMGMEQNRWNTKANPDMAVMNAFIRMTVGPMDYTPGAMINMSQESFQPGKESQYQRIGSMSTRCQQLALYVLYTSPLQMMCDSPSHYRDNPTSLEFIRQVPTVWDETAALHASPCESVVVARRSDSTWFIGGITDSQERTVEVQFSFLPENTIYVMKSWSDGQNANSDAQDHQIEERKVDAKTKLSVRMAKGGGFAAILRPQSIPGK